MKKTSSKISSPKKTYTVPVNESGYKINPIVVETQRQIETENKKKRRGGSFIIDTNPLGLPLNEPPLRANGYRGEARRILESKPKKQSETRKTSTGESSNVIVVRQPSNAGYVRRKPQEAGRSQTVQNAELQEVQDVTDLRARLRRTGQIEEGSGLHRVELARQHSHRVIDVQ